MPYKIEKDSTCPLSKPWAVKKVAGGKVLGCHASKKQAQQQITALYAQESKSMTPRTNSGRLERRLTPGQVEIRKAGGKLYIEGHAAVFNRLSKNLGGFVERIRMGAFTKTIKEADIRALMNHDENRVLGRNRVGTLELSQDDSGLYYRIDPPDVTYARDLMILLERGDISQSSFGFFTLDDDWSLSDQDFPVRELIEVSLVDVGPVTFPAYLDTDSGVGRSAALAGLARRSGSEVIDLGDPDAIREAIRKATAYHKVDVVEGDWDSGANVKRLGDDPAELRKTFAWQDPDGDPAVKSTYKLPHHEVSGDGEAGAANAAACSAAIAALNGGRGGVDIPDADRQAVYNHLVKHLKDGGREEDDIAPLRSYEDEEKETRQAELRAELERLTALEAELQGDDQ